MASLASVKAQSKQAALQAPRPILTACWTRDEASPLGTKLEEIESRIFIEVNIEVKLGAYVGRRPGSESTIV